MNQIDMIRFVFLVDLFFELLDFLFFVGTVGNSFEDDPVWLGRLFFVPKLDDFFILREEKEGFFRDQWILVNRHFVLLFSKVKIIQYLLLTHQKKFTEDP